jgi:hypothetical protein
LASQLTILIYKEGYPPEWDEEVFKKVLEQVENYKKGVSLDKGSTDSQIDTESVSIIPMNTKYPDLDEESYEMAADKRVDETEGDE